MKVYIVISYVDYECCHNVEGVFDSRDKAQDFIDNGKHNCCVFNLDIWEETVK